MSEVYGIIKRHNGKINVISGVGAGTTIKLRFPTVQKIEEKISPAKQKYTGLFNIYIIDDEEYILETLQDFLSDLGHTVQTNTSPKQALSDIKKSHYDIVITDLSMPGISGLELAEQIKALDPAIQLILISGWALNLDESDLENRIDFVINKPFSFEKITYVLSEVGKKLLSARQNQSL
jgi:CheY-like chemotaxis protein